MKTVGITDSHGLMDFTEKRKSVPSVSSEKSVMQTINLERMKIYE